VPREDSVLAGLDGTRPAVGAEGVKQVSSKKTFSGWLKDQPDDFQKDFFSKVPNGNAKYQLFKKGGLDAKDFIDPDGVQISLSELKQKHSLAWQKADVGETVNPTLTAGQRLAQQETDIGQNLQVSQREKANSLFSARGKSRDAAMALGQYPEKLKISSSTSKGLAFYDVLSDTVVSTNSKFTFTHEYGHYVDYNASKVIDKTEVRTPFSYRRGLHTELQKDAESLNITGFGEGVKGVEVKFNEVTKKYFNFKPVKYTKGKNKGKVKGYLPIPKDENVKGLSDIYDAASAGRFRKKGLPGHGMKYYKSQEKIATETFANMSAVYDTDLWPDVKKEFPLASARFEEILDEIINRD